MNEKFVLDLKANNAENQIFLWRLCHLLLICFPAWCYVFLKHEKVVPAFAVYFFLVIILMAFNYPMIKKVTKALKRIQKKDLIFSSDGLEISPIIIGVDTDSFLFELSLKSLYRKLNEAEYIFIPWSDIVRMRRRHTRNYKGKDVATYQYIIELTNKRIGRKKIILNRRWFAGQEKKFESLFSNHCDAPIQGWAPYLRRHSKAFEYFVFVVAVCTLIFLLTAESTT